MTAATTKKPKSAKPKKPRKAKATPTPAESALAEIFEASKEVDARAADVTAARQKLEEAKEILKGNKARWVEAANDLQEIIKEAKEPHLFNQTPPLKGAEPSANGHVDPQAWRDEPLKVLVELKGLSVKQLEKIEAQTELRTMGDLADYFKDGRKQWTDLPGIGDKLVEKLQTAHEKFWKRHPNAEKVVEEVAKATELPPAEEAK